MSRRARAPFEQRLMRQVATMAPGGHVIASSAPVVRPQRVTLGGAAPAPPPPPALDYGLFVIANGTDGSFDLTDGITPSVGDVLLALFASRGTTVTMPSGWTSLASGTSGALDYRVAYRVWTGGDDTTGSVSPYYDAPPPAWTSYDGYFDALVLHFIPTSGAPVPSVSGLVEVTGSASEAMPTGAGSFNVVCAIRSTDDIDTPYFSAYPTCAWTLLDVAGWFVGGDDDYAPAVAAGTVEVGGGSVDCDWVKFLVTWV